MNDVIILRDSPNYNHYLKKLVVVKTPKERDSVSYRLYTNDPSNVRYSIDENKKHTIMLAGGPRITEGDIIKSTDFKVLEILKITSEAHKHAMFIFVLEQISKDVQ